MHCIYDVTPTIHDIVSTVSVDQLYIWHHTHFMHDSLCTVHNVTSTLFDFTALYLSHYIHCILDITDNVYDITHMTKQPLYLSCHPLYLTLRPLYLCHQTQCINYTTPAVCMTSRTLYVWCHIQYALHDMNSLWHHTPICMTSHPVYLWHDIQYIWYHTYCFHDNTTTIPDISPTIFDITAMVSVSSQLLYRWHHNKYGSHHTWHTYGIIHTLDDITFTLYNINPQHLWHHKHCLHDIRSPIYDITSTVYHISSSIPVTSQPLYL